MCGISGIININNPSNFSDRQYERFASYNKYRGPDEYNFIKERCNDFSFFISHHRLSILDLTPTGKQPMCNDNHDIYIVFNGEIFNYIHLKNQLKKEGATFSGMSDTEVIIRAYEQWGIDKTMNQLEGMFSLCIIDISKSCAFIARDVFGKKPLYYFNQNNIFGFSSDIRSFKELNINLTLNIEALSYYFSELATPEENSIFIEIKKVKPGYYLKVTKTGVESVIFRSLKFINNQTESDPLNISEHIENLLIDSVKRRLVADVPVVCFLSGGIDSGLITAIASQHYGEKISTYTVGYENYPYDELPFAKLVSQRYNTDHHEIILDPEKVDIADKLIEEFGEPFADSSMIPSYYVCSVLSSKAKVALSGDGGDELFLGYPTYLQAFIMQQLFSKYRLFSFLTKPVSKILNFDKLNYLNGILNSDPKIIGSALYRNMGFAKNEINKLFKGNTFTKNAMEIEFERIIKSGHFSYDSIFNAVWYGTFKTRLLNDYLVKIDRSSMFASVEIRSPFLDDKLLQFVSSLQYNYLIPENKQKYILKQIAKKYLPEEIMNKPKTGFGIPVGQWFRNKWRKRFEEVVFEGSQNLIDLDYNYIQKLFKEHIDGANHDNKIWALYVFHYWCFSYFKKTID